MIKEKKITKKNKVIRARRTRTRLSSNGKLPRLTVFRSLKHLNLQIIDDSKGITLCSAHDGEIKDAKDKKPMEVAAALGELIAKKAVEKKITKIIFDRGSYQYHGKIKAVADGARNNGLKF